MTEALIEIRRVAMARDRIAAAAALLATAALLAVVIQSTRQSPTEMILVSPSHMPHASLFCAE